MQENDAYRNVVELKLDALGGEEKILDTIKGYDLVNPFLGLGRLTETLWKTLA